jgi:hypothetical protein
MWKKYCKRGQASDENAIHRMSLECWIPKVIDMPSEYEILIAFPQQK